VLKKLDKGGKFILSKKIKYYTKESLRFTGILVFGLSTLTLLFLIKFKPVYKVTLSGQTIGVINNKENINEAIEKYTNETADNIAFITISEKPSYELQFVDSMTKTNEEEVLVAVQNTAKVTYRMYAIVLEDKQKAVVASMEEAEKVVEDIKAELNQDLELDLKIMEVYDSNEISVETVETAVAKVNEDEMIQEKIREKEATVNGVVLKTPVAGTITSRFGSRRSGYHTGLDIANSTGTPITATAAGTVTYAGWKGSYGKLVVISHENGVETYYAHCSAIYVGEGQEVQAGETIGAVGNTGNSTGPHLHLEVRVNGNTVNPQNYLYR